MQDFNKSDDTDMASTTKAIGEFTGGNYINADDCINVAGMMESLVGLGEPGLGRMTILALRGTTRE